jgi:hypothetical protein
MTTKEYDQFLGLLENIVNADGSYKDKLAILIGHMDESDKTNMAELLSWFEQGEDGEDEV